MKSDATATSAPLLGEPLPVEFMNTIWADRNEVHDALATDGEVVAWVNAVEPAFATPDDTLRRSLDKAGPGDLAAWGDRLRELRNALRRIAAEQTDDPRTYVPSVPGDLEPAIAVLNRAAAASPHWSHLEWPTKTVPHRTTRTHADAGAALAAAIAERAIDFFGTDARHDLRACLAPGCVLYFVKHHPRREWCSTACGNRARAARHYQRHRRGG